MGQGPKHGIRGSGFGIRVENRSICSLQTISEDRFQNECGIGREKEDVIGSEVGIEERSEDRVREWVEEVSEIGIRVI